MSSKKIYVTVGIDEEWFQKLQDECVASDRKRSPMVNLILKQRYQSTSSEVEKEKQHAH